MKERRPPGFFTAMQDSELVDFYKKNYKGMARSQVEKKDGSFIRVIRKRKLISHIPLKENRKSKNYWQNWKNLEKELGKAIEQNKGEFPTQRVLNKMRKSTIAQSIKYHGGASSVKKRMGYKVDYNPDGYWQNWDNVERELNVAIEQNKGEFPSSDRLNEIKKGKLITGIRYFGGFPKVRKKMGYNQIKKSDDFYKNWKNLEGELRKVIKENNDQFPCARELKFLGLQGLTVGIYFHNGFPEVRERIGYNQQKREELAGDLEEIMGGF